MRAIRTIVPVLALALPGCISPEAHRDLQEANKRLVSQRDDVTEHLRELQRENQRLSAEVERLGSSAIQEAEFNRRKAELERLIAEFQKGGARAVPGVDVFRTSEGVVFRMQGEILFDSGKAEITDSGRATLRQLLGTLSEHARSGRNIRIDGHTDDEPIRRSSWKTNLRLSAERAMSVVAFLESNSIPSERLFVSAFGEHRPAVEGTDEAAKRANRRVEILMAGG